MSRKVFCMGLSIAMLFPLVIGLLIWGGSNYRENRRFWAHAGHETYKTPAELRAQEAHERQRGIERHKFYSGNPFIRAVALTFDDGPHPQYTPQLLAILRREHVRATFFVVGKMAERYPYLIQDEYAYGHLIGNHSFHHVNLTRIPPEAVRAEWSSCNDVVQRIIGVKMRYCRPPGGDYDTNVIDSASALGLTTVLWTIDPGDYARPGDVVIEERVLNHIGNGSIILLHDGVQQTVNILPQLIEALKREGFQFQTIDEMARAATW